MRAADGELRPDPQPRAPGGLARGRRRCRHVMASFTFPPPPALFSVVRLPVLANSPVCCGLWPPVVVTYFGEIPCWVWECKSTENARLRGKWVSPERGALLYQMMVRNPLSYSIIARSFVLYAYTAWVWRLLVEFRLVRVRLLQRILKFMG